MPSAKPKPWPPWVLSVVLGPAQQSTDPFALFKGAPPHVIAVQNDDPSNPPGTAANHVAARQRSFDIPPEYAEVVGCPEPDGTQNALWIRSDTENGGLPYHHFPDHRGDLGCAVTALVADTSISNIRLRSDGDLDTHARHIETLVRDMNPAVLLGDFGNTDEDFLRACDRFLLQHGYGCVIKNSGHRVYIADALSAEVLRKVDGPWMQLDLHLHHGHLLYAVDAAKRWLGTDDFRDAIVRHHLGATSPFWIAPLAPLDEHPDDPKILGDWLRDALRSDRAEPHPRLIPIRWQDHYSALVVWNPEGAAVFFDPHEGRQPVEERLHSVPPMDVLRAQLPRLEQVDLHDKEPSQRDPADTFCAVWMTMFFCRRWCPGQGLADVCAFLATAAQLQPSEFATFCKDDLGYTREDAATLLPRLSTFQVTDYLAAFNYNHAAAARMETHDARIAPPPTARRSLRLLTFNVSGFQHKRGIIRKIIAEANADIVALQEDPGNLKPPLQGYTVVAKCQAQQIRDRPKGHFLWNTILVTDAVLPRVERERALDVNITEGCVTPRCAASVRIDGIVIANVHLCGGAYDDTKWQLLGDVKKRQLAALMRMVDPDIIVGDFSGEPTETPALRKHTLYKRLTDRKSAFLEYYRSAHDHLRANGYAPVYPPDASRTHEHVEWVYIREALAPHIRSVHVMDCIGQKCSDHNAVLVDLEVTLPTAE